MKKTFKLLTLAGAMLCTGLAQAQTLVNIPDANFRNVLIQTQELSGCFIDNKLNIDCSGINNLIHLNISFKQISNLEGVQYLHAVKYLDCHTNQLTNLPQLPNSVKSVSCWGNQLTSLAQLPAALESLNCSGNKLTSLPVLPNTLRTLSCDSNQLAVLPQLPDSLRSLNCNTNILTSLPELPNQLYFLNIHSNPLACLPFLPQRLSMLNIDASTCLPNAVNRLSLYDKNYQPIPQVICDETNNKNNCQVYPHATGRIYIDANNDKAYTDGIDFPYVNKTSYYKQAITTDKDGMFYVSYELLNTDYSIEPGLVNGFLPSPANYIVNFSSHGQHIQNKDFIITRPAANDISIEATGLGVARPGFVTSYFVTVKNEGATVQNATVQFTPDPSLTYLESKPAGASAGNNVSFTIANLKPFEERIFTIDFELAAITALGTSITCQASVTSSLTDDKPENNTSATTQIVRGSCDPNDISVSKGNSVLRSEIETQENFIYTIRFQNTGTDTAFTVVIRDILSGQFDIKSIQTIAASNNYTLKLNGNVATWVFKNILLPDSTTNKSGSNGFVKYRIKPLSTLVLGEAIHNKAAIYFDYNEAVITNTATTIITTTIDTKDKTFNAAINVYPNPSKGIVHVSLGNQEAQLQVMTVTGNIVYEKTGTDVEHIDLSKQGRGIYFLKINTTEQSQVKKIILE